MDKLEHFRHILFFEFNRGVKAVEAARNICTIRDSTARKLFSQFKEDCFDISDTPCSGRPSGSDEDRLNILNHNDPYQRT